MGKFDLTGFLSERAEEALAERESAGLLRATRPWTPDENVLNLADNDYLGLASHPEVKAAAAEAIERHGCSASAAPLVTGFRSPHLRLVERIGAWYGVSTDQILPWNSGYAANHAVLGLLPQKGDLVLADRLVHHSMLAGILASGARLRRYPHLDLDQLQNLLEQRPSKQATFVVTETVFSMDGDLPDLARLAALRQRHRFVLVLDEAHALGWYGERGAGLAEKEKLVEQADILVGTLGKALGSHGAYAVFRDSAVKRQLENFAGEYVFSTFLAPAAAAAAAKAIDLAESLALEGATRRQASATFRQNLRSEGLPVPKGDSPIIPVPLGQADIVTKVADLLENEGLKVAAIRPPTVPLGTARLRLSLKAGLSLEGLAVRISKAVKAAR